MNTQLSSGRRLVASFEAGFGRMTDAWKELNTLLEKARIEEDYEYWITSKKLEFSVEFDGSRAHLNLMVNEYKKSISDLETVKRMLQHWKRSSK